MVNTANLALAQLNGIFKQIPNTFWLISPLSIREAVASRGIENINTTVAEIFEAELFPEEKSTGPNAKTIYYPPEDHEIIFDKLKNFENYFNDFSNDQEIDPLIKAAILHYQFEAIHPFLDGNGRTGRILIVLYLVLAKRLEVPILFISDYILKTRSEYYQVLHNTTFKKDWKSLVLYMLWVITTQALQTQNTVLKIIVEMKEFQKTLKEKNFKTGNIDFVNFIFSSPMITYESLSKGLNLHKNTASKQLNELAKHGLLKKTKYKKEVVFINHKLLEILK